MIPRIAHFVFGLKEQDEPFHFLHYVSLESCRRVLRPDAIYFHHKHAPWGPWWECIRRHLTLVEVDEAPEVLAANYAADRVPPQYRYAHHADLIRLDALIEHGGVYADIDTIFLRPFEEELFAAPFVIGREPPVRDELTGEDRPSLCNALLMSERDAAFARAWRAEIAAALNGTWSNHSGFLPEELSRLRPTGVRIEPAERFFPFPATIAGLSALLEQRAPLPPSTVSVHLWAHLWWEQRRRDFSPAHAGWFTLPLIRGASSTLADLARPYLPPRPLRARDGASSTASSDPRPSRWGYVSLDENSGYGTAAVRCMASLQDLGLELEWSPFVPGSGWGLGYEPALPLPGVRESSLGIRPEVLVAHLVPEYLPRIRASIPEPFLVAHTVWDTDRIPHHWVALLNLANLIVVPSRLSADAIGSAPISAPVEIVGHVAPPVEPGNPARWAHIPGDVFVFYTIAEWNERKAVTKTIEAYLRAFTSRDRVLLVVKTSHGDRRRRGPTRGSAGEGTSALAVAQLLADHSDPPALALVTRSLSDADISALHHRGDCYVSLARGEGFALGAFDAAAYGNPVVTTAFGGQLDYLAGSPYLVNFELVPVLHPAGFPNYSPDQRWAEPDVDHAAALLRRVARNPAEAAAVCEPLAMRVRERYSPQAIGGAFRAAVELHRSRPAPQSLTAGAPPSAP